MSSSYWGSVQTACQELMKYGASKKRNHNAGLLKSCGRLRLKKKAPQWNIVSYWSYKTWIRDSMSHPWKRNFEVSRTKWKFLHIINKYVVCENLNRIESPSATSDCWNVNSIIRNITSKAAWFGHIRLHLLVPCLSHYLLVRDGCWDVFAFVFCSLRGVKHCNRFVETLEGEWG